MPMLKFRFGSKESNSCRKSKWDENGDGEEFTPQETVVKAPSLEDSLKHFCSTATDIESHIGRVERHSPEPDIVPKGYNEAGQKVDLKPCLPATKDVPDDKIIQVWQDCEDDPAYEDWFYGKFETAHRSTGYAYRLVFELPLADVYKYDDWQNTAHPALPAPDAGQLELEYGTDLADLKAFKGKSIRTFDRGQIALIKRSLMAKRNQLKLIEDALNGSIQKLNEELEFRGQQLRYLTLYMGRNVETVIIKKGPKAADTELVHIRQRVLYMAEEVGVIEWEGSVGSKQSTEAGFDFRNIEDFDEWVVMPEHLNIIAPEKKCVVFLKPRRSDADYGNPILNFFMNRENNRVYALFRNGETVYRAQLDIGISDRLFPEEEKFERDVERERENKVANFYDSDWDWGKYQELWDARKQWYAKGFTDADFEREIKYKTKEEMLEAKAKAKAKFEAEKANPKETVPISEWDLKWVYERYQEELKEFFFGLAFIQGIFDRTDIFGKLEGKVNVFTGLGLGQKNNEYARGTQYVNLVYDLSESRMLEDKETPSLVAWLRSEAKKVKVGDYVIVRAEISRGYDKNPLEVSGIAQVVRVKQPGMIQARMNRDTWRYDYDWNRDPNARKHGIVHKLANRERGKDDRYGDSAADIEFYPWNLPMDKLRFYVERRADERVEQW